MKKFNVTARYTVWFDLDVEAEDYEHAIDRVLDDIRVRFKSFPGVIETDLGDVGGGEVLF